MANEWKSKYAIIRDLAAVTGGAVRVDIGAIITCDRPPAYAATEEIEDEFLRQFSGEVPVQERPDLKSIKMMLKVMNESEPGADEGDEDDVLTVTKLNPKCPEFVPRAQLHAQRRPGPATATISQTEADRLTMVLKEKITAPVQSAAARRERNVAVASLLRVQAGAAPLGPPAPPAPPAPPFAPPSAPPAPPRTLLTPDDFIRERAKEANNGDADTMRSEMVNRWFNGKEGAGDATTATGEHRKEVSVKEDATVTKVTKQSMKTAAKTRSTERVKPLIAAVSAAGMFKRRAVPERGPPPPGAGPGGAGPGGAGPGGAEPGGAAAVAGPTVYKPSAWALESYKKIKEMNDKKEAAAEGVWVAAQREMRRRDEEAARQVAETLRQLREEEAARGCAEHGTADFPAAVLLLRPRHDYDEPCAVCRAFCVNTDVTATNNNSSNNNTTTNGEQIEEVHVHDDVTTKTNSVQIDEIHVNDDVTSTTNSEQIGEVHVHDEVTTKTNSEQIDEVHVNDDVTSTTNNEQIDEEIGEVEDNNEGSTSASSEGKSKDESKEISGPEADTAWISSEGNEGDANVSFESALTLTTSVSSVSVGNEEEANSSFDSALTQALGRLSIV